MDQEGGGLHARHKGGVQQAAVLGSPGRAGLAVRSRAQWRAWLEEQRRQPQESASRLASLVKHSAAKRMFGNWDDSHLRRTRPRTAGSSG
jgi:hypothetical protein